jgi:hypothetical protein
LLSGAELLLLEEDELMDREDVGAERPRRVRKNRFKAINATVHQFGPPKSRRSSRRRSIFTKL